MLTQIQISQLIIMVLEKVQQRPFSFKSAKELRSRVELLPSGPQWLMQTVQVPGDPTSTDLILFYRDGLEVFKFLFGNPVYEAFMSYEPIKVYNNRRMDKQIYTDIMTGDWAWECQVLFFINDISGSNTCTETFTTKCYIGPCNIGFRQNPPHQL
jgi:hypothetical protein